MLIITIDAIPVPWAAHRGYGRNSFNPRYKEREFYHWQIKPQYNREIPIAGPVSVDYTYFLPIPKSFAKDKRRQALNSCYRHMVRPDLDNLNKFLSDALKGVVFQDDSQIVTCNSRKLYGEKPKTIIKIEELANIGLLP